MWYKIKKQIMRSRFGTVIKNVSYHIGSSSLPEREPRGFIIALYIYIYRRAIHQSRGTTDVLNDWANFCHRNKATGYEIYNTTNWVLAQNGITFVTTKITESSEFLAIMQIPACKQLSLKVASIFTLIIHDDASGTRFLSFSFYFLHICLFY